MAFTLTRQLAGSVSLPHWGFHSCPVPPTSRKWFCSNRAHNLCWGKGRESSLRTVLYPVVFLLGLFLFPALSYLEPKAQAPLLACSVCASGLSSVT